jgi:hypothetical protein
VRRRADLNVIGAVEGRLSSDHLEEDCAHRPAVDAFIAGRAYSHLHALATRDLPWRRTSGSEESREPARVQAPATAKAARASRRRRPYHVERRSAQRIRHALWLYVPREAKVCDFEHRCG